MTVPKSRLVGALVLLIVAVSVAFGVWLSTRDPVLVGAGDIANCETNSAQATAKLLDQIPGAVFTLGDNAYENGSAQDFSRCYDRTWGRFKARTRPALGNHDYVTNGASGYFAYFGAAAGRRPQGYYSYDLASWHVVVLNSNCDDWWEIGGCGLSSPQALWLLTDLETHPAGCTLAYWHHPRFSSGEHGNDPRMDAVWRVLYQFGVDMVLNGHDHDYERFAPKDPDAQPDPNGIREFVVGTGGASLRPFVTIAPNSELQNADTFGVMKLTLHKEGYDWEFIPVAGATFRDEGKALCVDRTLPPFTPGPYDEEVLRNHPFAYWPLGEMNGLAQLIARDAAGKHSGLIEHLDQATGTSGRNGRTGVFFNGVNTQISVGNADELNIKGDLSIEAWAKVQTVDSATHTIVHKGKGSTPDHWQYRLLLRSNNRWQGCIYIGDGEHCVTDENVVRTGEWTHLVMTRRGDQLTLSINGQSVGSILVSGQLNADGGSLSIGRSGVEGGRYFKGSINQVAIYGQALTLKQIIAHYDAGIRAISVQQ